MPELPEVEVTRRRLWPFLQGRRLAALDTTPNSYFFLTPPAELKRRLRGRRFDELERHGKYLLAGFDDGSRLLLHLGMTGQLFTQDATSPRLLTTTGRSALTPSGQHIFKPDGHTHLRFRFHDGGADVYFRDVRKFGKVRWLAQGAADSRLDKLGPDALGVTGELLHSRGSKRQVPVKSLLLDQGVLAGVGNIYADEALFLANLRPTRPAHRIGLANYRRLADGIRKVLTRSIETGGSSISDYVTPDGSDGRFQDERKVYAREGEGCWSCGTTIRRVIIAQRSSHYCPRCQK